MSQRPSLRAGLLAIVSLAVLAGGLPAQDRKPQPRPTGQAVVVPIEKVEVDDGDTFTITWAPGDTETVRILGIDTPETMHPDHGLPEDQEWGPEARSFAQGAVAFTQQVELKRHDKLDPYGRTLGYFFLDGRNYSVAVIEAHLALESVSHYGDNGFPEEAKQVLAAAQAAGKPPFEPPHEFRRRMRQKYQGAGSK
jgi:endonuclease YncB( thermonuclease family)